MFLFSGYGCFYLYNVKGMKKEYKNERFFLLLIHFLNKQKCCDDSIRSLIVRQVTAGWQE